MKFKLKRLFENKKLVRNFTVALALIVSAIVTGGPYLTYAASTIDTSTSSTATSNDSQRRTFFDTINNRHWSFYNNGSAIEYGYSFNETDWTSVGTLSHNTTDFSATYKSISGTSYVYIAAQCDSYDICVYKGTLSATNISWGSAYKPFDGSGASDIYDKATINLTDANNVVVASRHYNGTTYQAYTKTSTSVNDPSTWDTALTVGSTNASLNNMVLMPNGTNLHLLLNSKDNKLTVFRHTGSAWAEENDGASGGWINYGQATGASATVYSLAVDSQNNVYAGGNFTSIGGTSANYIARWDGYSWKTMGTGAAGGSYYVEEIAVDSQDNVYAGGYFTSMGGVSSTAYIAKWNGSAWTSIGSASAYVSALAVDSSDNLYAGGNFTTIGGVSATRIAKWNGTSWSALGTGAGNYVEGIDTDSSGNVYACGAFTTIGGVGANRIARWDGSAWNAMGTGMNNTVNTVFVSSSGSVYAGGSFTSISGVTNTAYMARWDGSAWNSIGGTGASAVVYNITEGGDGSIYAVGNFTTIGGVSANRIARLSESTWSALGTGAGSAVLKIIVDSNGLVYVGGAFTSLGGASIAYIGKWSSSAWSTMGTGADNYIYTFAFDSANNLYVGGEFATMAGVANTSRIAKWNGTSWSAMGTGANNAVRSIVVDNNDVVYAAGDFTTMNGIAVGRIAKWSSGAWSAVSTGTYTTTSIYSLAIDSQNNLYAGGWFTMLGGVSVNGIAKWNGTSWSTMGTGTSGTYPDVYSVAVDSSDNVYAGGRFTSMGGVTDTRYIAKWNGTAWSAMGTGAASYVWAVMADSNNNVYAGGQFASMGGVSNTANIAKWNGTSWTSIGGTGASSYVYAFKEDLNGDIYVGGAFNSIGGVSSTYYVAKYDGSTWTAINTAANNYVKALGVTSENSVYVGGQFTTFNGQGAGYFVKYTPGISSAIDSASPWSAYYTSNNIYALFKNNSQLRLASYNVNNQEWSNNITLITDASNIDSLSLGTTDNTMYAFYTESNAVKYLSTTSSPYYSLSSWNLTPTTFYSTGTNDYVSVAGDSSTSIIGVTWTNGTTSPYDVMFDSLGTTPRPSTFTWSGNGDGTSWDDPSNWDNADHYPNAATDTVTFSATSDDITIDAPLTIGELTVDSGFTGTLTLNAALTVDNASGRSGNLTIGTGATMDANGYDITIDGTFTNNGTLMTDGTETFNFQFSTTTGTTVYTDISGSVTLNQTEYNNLTLDASSASLIVPATTTINGALTLTNGTLDLQTNNSDITIKSDITIAPGATVLIGSGTSYFLGDFHYADNSGSANFGNIEIGASPDTIDLDTDMICSSLTINSGDILNTNGYDVDCSGGISIASTGLLDATDDVETDTTQINLGGNWSNGGTFTASDSTVTFDGTSTQSITSGTSDFYNLTNLSPSGITFTDDSGVTGTFTDTVSASTVTFNATSTYDFANINIAGATGEEIILHSSADDTQWFLNVTQSSPSADYVNVQDSDANGGNEIDASTGGINSGNNENWNFAPPVDPSISSDQIDINIDILPTISLTCDPTVTMNAITGYGQSDLSDDDNRATCTVATNNSTGYNLTWKSADTGSMVNSTSDVIPEYVPASAGVAEVWSAASTVSAWGAHIGYGSTTRNDSFWGSGTNARPTYSTGYNWLNVSTSDFSIVTRTTETSALGDTEYLWFGAEVGPSAWQPTGTYTQTVSLTASTL